MCYFIIVATKGKVPSPEPRSFQRLTLVEMTNPCLTRELGDEYKQAAIVHGMCSCDLYTPNTGPGDLGKALRRKERAYRSKGWSEAKINRALAQARGRGQRSLDQSPPGLDEDVRRFLVSLVRATGSVGVMVHFFGGSPEAESICLADSRRLTLDDLAGPCPIQEDRWYWIG